MEDRTKVLSGEIFALADELKARKKLKKELEDKVKEIGAEVEELDRQLSDAMTEVECSSFSHGGSTFYLNFRLFASPKAGMNDDMIAAFKEHGFGDIVKETINANTLASFCKEKIAESGDAETLPQWLSEVVQTHEKVTVGIRKL